MIIAIVGSRKDGWADPEKVAELVDDLLDGWDTANVVISGHAPSGVDFWVEESCKRRGIPFTPYPAAWRDGMGVFNPRAGFDRNEAMARDADQVISIWNGRSSGSKDMIDRTLRHKKHLEVFFP